jgi:hydrogenase maturation factor
MTRDGTADEPQATTREPRMGFAEARAPGAPWPLGKPPLEVLERLFAQLPIRDPRVVVGPRVGEDAAVLDIGDRYLVAKVDPITFVAEEIGWYAVHVNANDLAVRGATPAWFLMTLLLPEEQADEAMLAGIFRQVRDACRAVGASLVGGHTEVTAGLGRPILAGAMLGEVDKNRLVTTAGAQVGDAVLLSKGIAIEGTSILAREFRGVLLDGGIQPDLLERAAEFSRRPGISVLADAQAALGAGRVHAMHDPTEGGLATGLLELAQAANVGLRVDRDAIPVLGECRALCDALGVDPLGLIASGALLLTCGREGADRILAAWASCGIDGRVIGEVEPAASGCRLRWRGGEAPLPRFARDEVARLLDEG